MTDTPAQNASLEESELHYIADYFLAIGDDKSERTCREAAAELTRLRGEVERLTQAAQFYQTQYAAAVKVSMEIFQVGGPLYDLLTLGQSTLLDGPPAAAKEVARLNAQLSTARHVDEKRTAVIEAVREFFTYNDGGQAELAKHLQEGGQVGSPRVKMFIALSALTAAETG